jgi:hypothetical protein
VRAEVTVLGFAASAEVVAPAVAVVRDAEAPWRFAGLLARLDVVGFPRRHKFLAIGHVACHVVFVGTRVHSLRVHTRGRLRFLAASAEVVAATVGVVRNAKALSASCA